MTRNGMTKVQQETYVGEGLALGCLALDLSVVPATKWLVDFAFRSAWREWPSATRFPSVRADVQRDDIFRILNKSARRQGPVLAFWECGRVYEPRLNMEGWDINETADVLAESCGVTLSGWVALASLFAAQIKRNLPNL